MDQLYPMREEMARRSKTSDEIQINAEPDIPSPVRSTQSQSKHSSSSFLDIRKEVQSHEEKAHKQFLENLESEEKIQNQKIEITRQQEREEREKTRQITNQEWQERRRTPASEEFDFQKWKKEQKLKEKKRDDFNFKYTEHNKRVAQLYKDETSSMSPSSSPQKKAAKITFMKKTLVEKMIEMSKIENVPLYRVNMEKIMDFICKELGTELQKIPMHIRAELQENVKNFQKYVKAFANSSAIKRRASLLLNSSWCDTEYCVPPSLTLFVGQTSTNDREESFNMIYQAQKETNESESAEQLDSRIHSKEFCTTSSIFSYLKNYNINDHGGESNSNCPSISNLELCKFMKSSGFAFGDLLNQQNAIYQHILSRLGISESKIDAQTSTDLHHEIEIFTVKILHQYNKSSYHEN
jgi:hypothetical protein